MNTEQEIAFNEGYEFAKKELEAEGKINPFKCLDFLRDNAKNLAKAERDVTYFTEFRKSKKALLMLQSNAKTESGKETYAYSHKEYIKLLDVLANAKEDYVLFRWLMIASQAKIEVWRSLESSARAEGKATL
jgi:hypothetical protein